MAEGICASGGDEGSGFETALEENSSSSSSSSNISSRFVLCGTGVASCDPFWLEGGLTAGASDIVTSSEAGDDDAGDSA